MTATVHPLLLSVPEAAATLALSTRAVYRLIDGGHIEAVHIGRATRIPTQALEAYVQQLRETA